MMPFYPAATFKPVQYNFNPGGMNAKMKYSMKGVRGLVLVPHPVSWTVDGANHAASWRSS